MRSSLLVRTKIPFCRVRSNANLVIEAAANRTLAT